MRPSKLGSDRPAVSLFVPSCLRLIRRVDRRQDGPEGWSTERLIPLPAGLDQLLFRLKLWHNALDPAMGLGLGDDFADFVHDEARALGYTSEQVRGWEPAAGMMRGRRGRRS